MKKELSRMGMLMSSNLSRAFRMGKGFEDNGRYYQFIKTILPFEKSKLKRYFMKHNQLHRFKPIEKNNKIIAYEVYIT